MAFWSVTSAMAGQMETFGWRAWMAFWAAWRVVEVRPVMKILEAPAAAKAWAVARPMPELPPVMKTWASGSVSLA